MFPLQKYVTHENVAPAFAFRPGHSAPGTLHLGRAPNQAGWGSAGGAGVRRQGRGPAALLCGGSGSQWDVVPPVCSGSEVSASAGTAMGMRAHGHVVVLSQFE